MAKNKNTDLAPFEERFPIRRSAEIIKQVFGDRNEPIAPNMLEQIKVPPGGTLDWQFENGSVREFKAVILDWKSPRSYWASAIGDTADPPDCSSEDGVTGNGDNGAGGGFHPCGECPQNAWGSATGDDGKPRRGKACREGRRVLILREGLGLPSILNVPPTSIQNYLSYIMRACVSHGLIHSDVVTTFTIEPVKNGALTYGTIKMQLADVLDEQARADLRGTISAFAGVLDRPDRTDDEGGANG